MAEKVCSAHEVQGGLILLPPPPPVPKDGCLTRTDGPEFSMLTATVTGSTDVCEEHISSITFHRALEPLDSAMPR